jgi:ABC-type multidrug transport system fused ATPase/permease subunit
MPRLWLEVMAVTGLAMLVILMVVQGRQSAEIIPLLALFGVAAFRLLPSIGKIIGAAQSARFGNSVLKMLQSELSLEIPDPLPLGEICRMSGDIALANVTFTYSGTSQSALKDISLTIHQGETVGFIGPSGAGKSSLVDLILGLLNPDSGQITVGNQPIVDNLRAWQDQIGYVPQSIFLTDDTLRRNISFGLSEDRIDDAAIQRALVSAQLSEFVETLPEGLETIVGERGIRLSGGQRQRIGVARALYHDPSILVLDEATSALDSETESGVMEAIDALKGSKTVIIVAHRLSTVEKCDRVFRLEAGKLVEAGTPAEILRKSNRSSSRPESDLGLTA